MSSLRPVLVIGAGPSGLAAALTLAKNNVPVRIIDKATSFHKMSRGNGQHIRTLEIFRFLGVLDDIRRSGAPLRPIRLYKLPGGTQVLRTWEMTQHLPASPDLPYTESMGISQYLTEKVLREHLSSYGVHVELGTEPFSLTQEVDSVTTTLKKIDKDGRETAEEVLASYVIGADGARGLTRKFIGATFEGETRDAEGGVFAECELEGDGITPEFWHAWMQPGKVGAFARPRPEGGYAVGFLCSEFDPIELVDPIKFVEFFHEATDRKDIVFKKIEGLTHWKPNIRMANKFSDRRVFIVGDAAHVHPPTGGQGLNTSVQDSFNLAWKLALAHKGLAAPSLLQTYNDERLPVVAQMLAATAKIYTNVTAKPSAPPPATGNPTSTPTDRATLSPDTSDAILSQWRNRALTLLEVNYRFGALTLDVRGSGGLSTADMTARAYEGYGPAGGVRAGDRAPDASGLADARGVETSLFALFSPATHTVLIFLSGEKCEDAKVGRLLKRLESYPKGTVKAVVIGRDRVPDSLAAAYHDKHGHGAHAYQIDEGAPAVVVVRPDAYVGAYVHDETGVQEYFSRVFNTI